MRRTAVINFKNFDKTIRYLKENKVLLILIILFLAGLFWGVSSFDGSETFYERITEYITDEYTALGNSGFWKTLIDSFFNSLLPIAVCFILGCSILGIILSPLCMLLSGFVYGTISAVLYSEYALNGIAFYAVMILPSAVINIIALIIAVKESVRFSSVITSLTFPATAPKNLSYEFKSFGIRYIIVCSIVLLASLTDALITCNLAGSFVLN